MCAKKAFFFNSVTGRAVGTKYLVSRSSVRVVFRRSSGSQEDTVTGYSEPAASSFTSTAAHTNARDHSEKAGHYIDMWDVGQTFKRLCSITKSGTGGQPNVLVKSTQ